MSFRHIIEEWVEHFNNQDAIKFASLYDEDAINHQVVQDPIKGKQAIFNMFKEEFARAEMTCIVVNIFEDENWVILEWKDPLGLQGCGFFQFKDGLILFQRGYWDRLSFLRMHGLPIPDA